MSIRMSMSNLTKVVEAYRSPKVDIRDLTSLYESGMKSVLAEIAVSKLIEFENDKVNQRPEKLEETMRIQDEKYNKFVDTLTEEQRELLNELDSSYMAWMSDECEFHFVNGFIAGYSFIKTLKESWKTGLFV